MRLVVQEEDVDPLYVKYTSAPTEISSIKFQGSPNRGFRLKDFLSMCQQAQLIGVQLSRMQVSRLIECTVGDAPMAALPPMLRL